MKYVLAAVLKKHKFFAVGDSFAQAQDQQEISIVERIDVSLPELQTGGSVHEEVQTEGDDDDPRRVHVAVRMPRFAIARGKTQCGVQQQLCVWWSSADLRVN